MVSMNGWNEAWTLNDYIESLLRDGKRSQHPDFQALFIAFGEQRIRDLVSKIMAQMKARQDKRD